VSLLRGPELPDPRKLGLVIALVLHASQT